MHELRVLRPWVVDEDFGEATRLVGRRGRGDGRGRGGARSIESRETLSSDDDADDIDGVGEAEVTVAEALEVEGRGGELVVQVDAMADLAEIRSAWTFEDQDTREFYISVRGGTWTLEHRGTAADSLRALAQGGDATRWCARWQWPRIETFAFGRYGRDGCNRLGHEWCRRPQ